MQNITLKKILLAIVVIALAVFLFKYIGIILAAVSVTLIVALRWVLKGLVIIGALLLVYTIFTKN
ncbi:MAG: hypothetical protein IKN85_13955 [Oscillospiraceae bacterium]|jgi:hypothetical protein|nr:hypothetical protein [Oscillospiraceae bacterium]MBR3025375.1 hypothetical protein [Oscillospiraceae bacterium]MBR3536923.1 hypothetical protein [Oscillospiraceae bacterium]MBR6837120.1 hypothetical protein [Oscillospiraceae bacterium]